MRDVEEFTSHLAKIKPDIYAPFSRSSLSILENEGAEWMTRTPQHKNLRAAIHLLFETDSRFVQLSGVVPPYGLTAELLDFTHSVAQFNEGDDVTREDLISGNGSVGTVEAATAETDFCVIVTQPRMRPFVAPGQVLHCALTLEVQPGEMAIINRRTALEVAWYVGKHQFAHTRGSNSFSLPASGALLGRVVSMKPFLPITESEPHAAISS